jgi:glycosyltransferase involved in cell wall biosynthesis
MNRHRLAVLRALVEPCIRRLVVVKEWLKTMNVTNVEVDIIIPVHNAAKTIEETVESAMHQEIPLSIFEGTSTIPTTISVTVCCYDDASTDDSFRILQQLQRRYDALSTSEGDTPRDTQDPVGPTIIPSRLLICASQHGEGLGAGYARNRAIEMNNPSSSLPPKDAGRAKFLCFLDSDDVMHKNRIAEQTFHLLSIRNEETRRRTLLGCTFVRDPPDATWHYSDWANNLSDERLVLERFREITVLQPTWFMPYAVWANVGGYAEAPPLGGKDSLEEYLNQRQLGRDGSPCLIHPKYDTAETLRLAEDLRFFHAHLQIGGQLRLHRGKTPLVTYRHAVDSSSQSFRTSRKLLLQLRVLAFQNSILCKDPKWNQGKFVIWGAGRDGKDFFKALDLSFQRRVYCFVDVDAKKLNAGYYVYQQQNDDGGESTPMDGAASRTLKVPIVHFSYLINDRNRRVRAQAELQEGGVDPDSSIGRIDKSRHRGGGKEKGGSVEKPHTKKQKRDDPKERLQLNLRGLSQELLESLPVVVCVAMYRTNGVLEQNVASIGRREGDNLWHFS